MTLGEGTHNKYDRLLGLCGSTTAKSLNIKDTAKVKLSSTLTTTAGSTDGDGREKSAQVN